MYLDKTKILVKDMHLLWLETFHDKKWVHLKTIKIMLKQSLLLLLVLILLSCKDSSKESVISYNYVQDTLYASGFRILQYEDYKIIEVTKAFPNSKDTLRYALVEDQLNNSFDGSQFDQVIQIPIESIVVTSTTHIPSLEMLGVDHTLVGFPNLDYVSSALSRKRIQENKIKELGQNESINTEVLIDLEPDAVVSFGVEGENTSMYTVEKSGIPVLYNGDWVEQDPLGKAEWIKFFGALYGKSKEADSIFSTIEKAYLETKKLTENMVEKPTVLSGAMYKDVWYLPKGESWPAQLIKDAGGNYLWSETEGTGSLSLSIEAVLEKGQEADFWIAPAQYASYSKLAKDHAVYTKFEAFQNKKTYTFSKKRGETGGLLYYELAPNRPDLVLKDMVHYLHPDVLPNYEPYFFSDLDE